MSKPSKAAAWAAVFGWMCIGHLIGDYGVQDGADAGDKQKLGPAGAAACGRHVLTYTAVNAVTVGLADALLDLDLTWPGILAGQAISAATHYPTDRGPLLHLVAKKLGRERFLSTVTVVRKPGNTPDGRGPGTGAHALDQMLHFTALAFAAAATVAWRRSR